jgi:predicted transcriptional regulator of viral defense system
VWPHHPDLATLRSDVLHSLPNAFTHQQARRVGLSERRLRAYVEQGALERLGRGIYRRADAPPTDLDWLEIALRAPEATLCLTSALAHHDLTDIIPSAIEVALPRSQRPPRVGAPVRWHRFDDESAHVGREKVVLEDDIAIAIYSAERSVIDAFRLRHLEGPELAVEALRRWLKRPGASPSTLLEMARLIPRGEPALLQALRYLL